MGHLSTEALRTIVIFLDFTMVVCAGFAGGRCYRVARTISLTAGQTAVLFAIPLFALPLLTGVGLFLTEKVVFETTRQATLAQCLFSSGTTALFLSLLLGFGWEAFKTKHRAAIAMACVSGETSNESKNPSGHDVRRRRI